MNVSPRVQFSVLIGRGGNRSSGAGHGTGASHLRLGRFLKWTFLSFVCAFGTISRRFKSDFLFDFY